MRPHLMWVNQFAVGPTASGGTRHFEIGRELVKLGWDVTVVASDFNLQSREFSATRDGGHREPILERIDDVSFVWLWTAPYRRNDWRRARNWLSFGQAVTKLAARHAQHGIRRPDVIIGSSPQLLAAHSAMRAALKFDAPFVLEVRDLWPESLSAAGGKKGVLYAFLHLVAKRLYRRAARIIVLARGVSEYLTSHYGIAPSKTAWIPNGVDASAFPIRERAVRTKTKFVYTGAHGPANGLDVILDAAERFADRDDIEITLIGSGPAKDDLIQACETRGLSNVQFLPPIPKQDIPAWLSNADAGLMLLKPAELFSYAVSPNKLFDYMAAGLPIVCNVAGDVAEIVEQARAGVQAKPGDATSLAQAMKQIADMTPAERARIGANARTWVQRENSREVLASKLNTLLQPLLPPELRFS